MNGEPAADIDAVRARLRRALKAKRLSMARVSSHAGFGDTYLFDALDGRKGDGSRRLGGTMENFAFIARTIGLNQAWLMSGAGPMWAARERAADDAAAAGAAGDDPADLLAVIEEALCVFLGASPEAARASARALADLARIPPRLRAGADRAQQALRRAVRAVLQALKGEAD